jgi:hypothetical protein
MSNQASDSSPVLTESQLRTIRSDLESLKAHKPANKLDGPFWIEFVKVFSAGVLGLGGIMAAISGYQLADVKRERVELETERKRDVLKEREKELSDLTGKRDQEAENLNVLQSQVTSVKNELKDMTDRLNTTRAQMPAGTDTSVIDSALRDARRIEFKIAAADTSSKNVQKPSQDTNYYYVIALTTSTQSDAEAELARVSKKVGDRFSRDFPNARIYAPDPLAAYTVLVSGEKLPFAEANALKKRAIEAGFNKETWLWQSSVSYFSAISK